MVDVDVDVVPLVALPLDILSIPSIGLSVPPPVIKMRMEGGWYDAMC